MATKTVLIDDLDGSENNVETVRFAVDGVTYHIDLSDTNRAKLKETLEPFIKASHSNSAESKKRASQASQIRVWAKKNKVDVPAQGRIPKAILQQWEESKRGK